MPLKKRSKKKQPARKKPRVKKGASVKKAATKKLAVRKVGRPTIYKPKTIQNICTRLAVGESMRSICRDENMPVLATVMYWLFDGKHPEFLEQYNAARQIQAELYADEINEISDDGRNDYMLRKDKNGKQFYATDNEHIQRSKLRVDTRKWVASRLLPKYKDKQETKHTGALGVVNLSDKTEEELKAIIRGEF